jgi:D-lyxose ketol-isomerase
MIKKASIVLKDEDLGKIAAADFGLSRLEKEGAQILTLLETERVAFKILTLFPYQTEPEHWHPQVGDDPGKEETVRLVYGTLYFYIPGEDNMRHGFVPEGK